jgi:hypothetical protein
VIWAEHSKTSRWVYSEATEATEQNKLLQVCDETLDRRLMPMPFKSGNISPVTDRAKIYAALAHRGIVPFNITSPRSLADCIANHDRLLPKLGGTGQVLKALLYCFFLFIVAPWSTMQVFAVPWSRFDEFPLWKVLLIVIMGGVVFRYFDISMRNASRILRSIKRPSDLMALLNIVVLLLPILKAVIAAGILAWAVNHVNF